MTPQRKKGPVKQKRFVVLLEGDGLFDRKMSELIRREAPEVIFETLAGLKYKTKSELAAALGMTRNRLAALLVDLGITSIFRHIREHGPKKRPDNWKDMLSVPAKK